MRRLRRSRALLAAVALLVVGILSACGSAGGEDGRAAGDMAEPPEVTPPPQTLLLPGESAEGELEEGHTDRWVFATAGGRLATVEIWFRPATASGPEAQMQATLLGPDGTVVIQDQGTVTLPPYLVEQELPETGSYLLRLEALSGRPGRYTVLVTLSDERLLTNPEVYTSTVSGGGPLAAGSGELTESQGFLWPSPRREISGWYFHDPENSDHIGLDIATALHDPLFAAAAGTVSFADWSGGYGNLVVIDHADGWQSWYAHLSRISVVPEQEVGQGEIIGAAGSTGFSTGPHLHFELRHAGVPVDPLVYLH